MIEAIPLKISITAVKVGRYFVKGFNATRLARPKEIIRGNVPNQNNAMIKTAEDKSAEASAKATKEYSHPQGMKVVINPIKKGFSWPSLCRIALTKLPSRAEAFPASAANKFTLRLSNLRVPIAIRVIPTMKADIRPNTTRESILAPSVAAIIPSDRYVVNRPRL